MELELLYKMKAVDEFNRYFEANFKIDGKLLIFQHEAEPLYFHMMTTLAFNILARMGTEAKAEWSVEVIDLD